MEQEERDTHGSLRWVARFVQIGISAANLCWPSKLKYHQDLERVAAIIRQIFLVHFAYVVGIVLLLVLWVIEAKC